MTAAPAAVVPAPAKRAPRSLVSVSAKKLSEGGSIRPSSCVTVGEDTWASGAAPDGGLAAPLTPRTLTPLAFSAAHSLRAALAARAGAPFCDPLAPHVGAKPLSVPSRNGSRA